MSGILYTEEGVIENGTIRFRNEEVHHLPPDELVRRGIVQVPEGRRVFPALTIDENLQMGGYTKTTAEGERGRAPLRASDAKKCSRCSRACSNGATRSRATCPGEQQMLAIGGGGREGASSRCWRSAAP